jgi:hypothetical protein
LNSCCNLARKTKIFLKEHGQKLRITLVTEGVRLKNTHTGQLMDTEANIG